MAETDSEYNEFDHWNYRVCYEMVDGESWLAIYEVHYDSDGKIVAHSKEPMTIIANDMRQFNEMLNNMLSQPVLDLVEIGKNFKRKEEK
jgi:hypothetical protein